MCFHHNLLRWDWKRKYGKYAAFPTPHNPQLSRPWWYWKRAEIWVCLSRLLIPLTFLPAGLTRNPNWISYAKRKEMNPCNKFLLSFGRKKRRFKNKKRALSHRQTCVFAVRVLLISWAEVDRSCLLYFNVDFGIRRVAGQVPCWTSWSVMCSVWVFIAERMPLGIPGGDWLMSLLLKRTLNCRVNDWVRVQKEHKCSGWWSSGIPEG